MSEVKGPVMDRLKDTHFLKALTGKVFLTQFAAVSEIRAEIASKLNLKLQEARSVIAHHQVNPYNIE